MEYPDMTNLNSLQAFIFWFFAIIGVGIYKFLAKIMPVTANLFLEFLLSKIEDRIASRIEKKIKELENKVDVYKAEKNALSKENTKLRGAIYSDDQETLNEYRNEKK